MLLTLILLGIVILIVICYLLTVIFFLPKFGVMSMPEDIKEVIMNMPEQPKWKTVVGYICITVLVLGLIETLIMAGVLAVREQFSFGMIFVRYLIILWGYKAFDIVVLDWLLITKLNFFQKLFPETKNCKGYHCFGFNKRKQIGRIIAIPIICLMISIVITQFT